MTTVAVGRISRIEFQTDLTRGNAPLIPLGFLLEAAWIDQARWLGLIGRTTLIRPERDLINFATWPELEKPFVLLERLFDRGWDVDWGEAGSAVQADWCRSALSINVADASAFIANLPIETRSRLG